MGYLTAAVQAGIVATPGAIGRKTKLAKISSDSPLIEMYRFGANHCCRAFSYRLTFPSYRIRALEREFFRPNQFLFRVPCLRNLGPSVATMSKLLEHRLQCGSNVDCCIKTTQWGGHTNPPRTQCGEGSLLRGLFNTGTPAMNPCAGILDGCLTIAIFGRPTGNSSLEVISKLCVDRLYFRSRLV